MREERAGWEREGSKHCRLQGPPREEEVKPPGHDTDDPQFCLRETQGRSLSGGQAPLGESWERRLCPFVPGRGSWAHSGLPSPHCSPRPQGISLSPS